MSEESPSHCFIKLLMTASFSTGLKEHVEYTSRPLTASNSKPLVRILSCSLQNEEDMYVPLGRYFNNI